MTTSLGELNKHSVVVLCSTRRCVARWLALYVAIRHSKQNSWILHDFWPKKCPIT